MKHWFYYAIILMVVSSGYLFAQDYDETLRGTRNRVDSAGLRKCAVKNWANTCAKKRAEQEVGCEWVQKKPLQATAIGLPRRSSKVQNNVQAKAAALALTPGSVGQKEWELLCLRFGRPVGLVEREKKQ